MLRGVSLASRRASGSASSAHPAPASRRSPPSSPASTTRSAGRVTIDGHDLRDCSLDWLREQVGLLLQEPILFTGTVAENIGYGIDGVSEEQIVAAAKAANAHEFVERLPLGYETPLGPRGEGLSGGQKQRLAIARTLLRDPAVLVLDEPTTGLDEASEDAVLAGLARLMRGRTILVITHSPGLAALADRTMALKDGRVAFDSDTDNDPRPAWRAPTPTPHDRALLGLARAARPRGHGSAARGRTRRRGGADGRTPALPAVQAGNEHRRPLRRRARRRPAPRRDSDDRLAQLPRAPRGEAGEPGARLARSRSRARALVAQLRREIGALVQWFPLDLSLPALAEPRSVIREELEAAGSRSRASGRTRPCSRTSRAGGRCCRVGGDVVKFYAKEDEFRAAAHGLRASARLHGVTSPTPGGVLTSRRVTVQRLLPGRQPEPEEAAEDAGRMLAELHSSSPCSLPTAPPASAAQSRRCDCGADRRALGHARPSRRDPARAPRAGAARRRAARHRARRLQLAPTAGLGRRACARRLRRALPRARGARPRDLRGLRRPRRRARARAGDARCSKRCSTATAPPAGARLVSRHVHPASLRATVSLLRAGLAAASRARCWPPQRLRERVRRVVERYVGSRRCTRS